MQDIYDCEILIHYCLLSRKIAKQHYEVGTANCYCMIHKLSISLFCFALFQAENICVTIIT